MVHWVLHVAPKVMTSGACPFPSRSSLLAGMLQITCRHPAIPPSALKLQRGQGGGQAWHASINFGCMKARSNAGDRRSREHKCFQTLTSPLVRGLCFNNPELGGMTVAMCCRREKKRMQCKLRRLTTGKANEELRKGLGGGPYDCSKSRDSWTGEPQRPKHRGEEDERRKYDISTLRVEAREFCACGVMHKPQKPERGYKSELVTPR
jgi:hypothetical protein